MKFDNLNQSELSKALGFSVRSVSRWLKLGLPRNQDGSFCIADCVKWLLFRAEENNNAPGNDEAQKWLTMFRKERAKISELERKKLEGQLISVNAVESQFGARAFELRRNMELLSRRIGQRLAAVCSCKLGDITRLLDAEMWLMLAVYSRQMIVDGVNIQNECEAEIQAVLNNLKKNKQYQTEISDDRPLQ